MLFSGGVSGLGGVCSGGEGGSGGVTGETSEFCPVEFITGSGTVFTIPSTIGISKAWIDIIKFWKLSSGWVPFAILPDAAALGNKGSMAGGKSAPGISGVPGIVVSIVEPSSGRASLFRSSVP